MNMREIIALLESEQVEEVDEAAMAETTIQVPMSTTVALDVAEALNHVGREVFNDSPRGEALKAVAREITRRLSAAGHVTTRRY